MTTSGTKTPSNWVWNILSSLKLTLVLLVILAAVSIFGTLIPQQQGALEFARSLSPGLFKLFSSLQLFDMYHSIWFRLIIGALALNLIVCTLNRLPTTLKLFRTRAKPDRSRPFENLPPERDWSAKGEMRDIANQVMRSLSGTYKHMIEKETDQGIFLHGDKGRTSYFGVYIVHFSVLLILIGGIVGSIWGFSAYVNIPEGETAETVFLSKSRASKKLGFSIACDKFIVDFYENGAPKVYQSNLRFLNNGKVIAEGNLRVNHPITVQGITFYQASYGEMPGGNIRLKITSHASEEKSRLLEVQEGRPVNLPGREGTLQVIKVEQDLKGMMGPAALISISPDQGEEIRFWVFKNWEILKKRFPPAMLNSPMLNPSAFAPYTLALESIESKFYTGLQVSKDPGVLLVWAGFFLIIVGLFMAFFMSHRKIWIRISQEGQRVNIRVAGNANKNGVGMENELNRISLKLQNLFS